MIQDYLVKNGFYAEDLVKGLKKKELLEKLRAVRPQRKYVVDELLKKENIVPVRLPPYFCIYNPIENIWSVLKNRFRRANTCDFSVNQAKALLCKGERHKKDG